MYGRLYISLEKKLRFHIDTNEALDSLSQIWSFAFLYESFVGRITWLTWQFFYIIICCFFVFIRQTSMSMVRGENVNLAAYSDVNDGMTPSIDWIDSATLVSH
jgi:hypothetical protein